MSRIIRAGILGAGRGASLGRLLDLHPQARTVALCESDPQRMARARETLPHLEACYTDYETMLGHELDLVVVANDATAHVPYVLRALETNRHVFSEVLACHTLAEGVMLARAVERASTLYMFGENCCYMRPTLEMKRLYRAGELGEYLYGECEYMHDCTPIWPRLTYGDPNHWRNAMAATIYCSHSLGPILDITGARPVRCVGFTTPNTLGRQVGRRGDDIGLVVCQMDNGAVTKTLMGIALRREPATHWYSLYGTRGHAENQRGVGEDLLHVYREADRASEYAHSYVPTFPRDLAWARAAGGHGGADAQMIDELLRAILEGAPSPIDVYTGLDMTLPGILGIRSAQAGNVPLEVPDFRQEAVRIRYENDHWAPDPLNPSAHGPIDVSAEG